MRIVDLRVPEIGGFAKVIQVVVQPGDAVTEYAPILTLETEEATFEVPTRFAGTVRDVKVKLGDTVTEGTPLASISVTNSTTSTAVVGADADDQDETVRTRPRRSSAKNPLRAAILVAFVGATFWVFAPLVIAGLFTSNPHGVAILLQGTGQFASGAAWDALVARAVQNEIAVATIAAVAWVTAVMVKGGA